MSVIEKMKTVMHKLRGLAPDGLPESVVGMKSSTAIKVIRANGRVEDLGVVSRKCVTNAFVNYLVSSFLTSSSYALDLFKYHDCGSGNSAEAAADTQIGTSWGGARATGTNTNPGTTNVFQSVATAAFTAAKSIQEHGVFSSATTGAGTLLDRSTFALISVASGDSIAFTYQLTCTAGG
jgi:hypothetical protein